MKVLKERWPSCNDKEKMLLCHEGWVEIFCLIILQCKESSPTMLFVLLYLSQSH